MSKEINIPLYRAKKIDSDEYITGTGTTDFINMKTYEKFKGDGRFWVWSNYSWIEVDILTFEISFNSGETWFSAECVNSIMNSSEIVGVQE